MKRGIYTISTPSESTKPLLAPPQAVELESPCDDVFENALEQYSNTSQSFSVTNSVEHLPPWVSDLVERDRTHQHGSRNSYTIFSQDILRAFDGFANPGDRTVKFAFVDEIYEVPRWDKKPEDWDKGMKKATRREFTMTLKRVWSKENGDSLVYKLLYSGALVGIVAMKGATRRL